jgi:hypothetical protein
MLDVRTRSKAIRSVVAGTLALLSYLPDTDAAFAASSDPFVAALVDVLVDEAERDARPPNRQGVLRRLAHSASPAIRGRVAEAAGALGGDELATGLTLLQLLSRDEVRSVRAAAARGLAHLIDCSPDLVRTAVESQWATAAGSSQREVLAVALGRSRPDWLTDLALAELANDGSVHVRRAALHSAQEQLEHNPDAYVQLAATLLADADRGVRKSARKLLRHAEPAGWASALKPGAAHMRESKRRLRRAMRGDVARQLSARASFQSSRGSPEGRRVTSSVHAA